MKSSHTAISKRELAIVCSLVGTLLLAFFYTLNAQEEKKWPLPSIAKETIYEVQNPYRIKEYVYYQGTHEKQKGGGRSPHNLSYCSARIYSLFDIPAEDNFQDYLNSFEKRFNCSK